MRTTSLSPAASSLLCFVVLAITGCNGGSSPFFADFQSKRVLRDTLNVPIPSSPNTGALQGVAINGTQTAFVSSNNSLAAYSPTWTLQWQNTNELAGLPGGVNHIGDIAYFSGKLIAPVTRWVSCSNYNPVLLAVYDARNSSLLTWSDISADGVSGSSVAVIPEQNKVVVASFCDVAKGFTTLWNYDLNAVITNPPGAKLSAVSTTTISVPIAAIQGISWNSALGQFLVSSDAGGPAGTLWHIAADGVVSGPAYVVPGTVAAELEGVDFSTGYIYYLENGYVYNIGAPVSAPIFNIQSGTYTSTQSVVISSATTGAVIHYATDGSMPTASSPNYSGPIEVSNTQTIKAIATLSGYANSITTIATYTIR